MRTGWEILQEQMAKRGLKADADGTIPESVFCELGLPMVVACTDCDERMAMPLAYVDEDDPDRLTYCADCAENAIYCRKRDQHPDGECGGPNECPICAGELERAELERDDPFS